MPTRLPASILSVAAALLLAACSPEAEPKGCRSNDQCPASARCEAGVCVANAAPVAAIRPISAVESFALVDLDGSDSRESSGDAALAEHVWAVRSLTAPCTPPEIAGLQPIARVRFGCPGRYEVSLEVRDRRGVVSAPATAQVEVVASRQAPVVIAGADLASDHACAGDPLVCRPTDPIALSASTTLPGVALQWSVEPPRDRPLDDGTRRVWLAAGTSPGAAAAFIETDGTAISGDWIFRVEASDAYGAVGAAFTRVTIRNRLPIVVADAPAPFAHAFDGAAARFRSSGEIAWSAHDPDGDPIEIHATWRHVGDGGAPFAGQLSPGKATFAIEVPYATPADALHLRGGADLARTIEVVARDSNRGEVRAVVPIEIGNTPPQPAGGPVDARVPHTFDAARSRYVANVQLGAWTDPDGDPLFGGVGTAPCDAIAVVDGVALAECSVPFEGTPAVDRIAGYRSVTAAVRDPWELARAVPVHGVEIRNSAPTLTRTTDLAGLTFTRRIGWTGTACLTTVIVHPAEFTAFPRVSDPDGDPVVVRSIATNGGTASPLQALCTSPECVPFRFSQTAVSISGCSPTWNSPSWLSASDGHATVQTDASPPPATFVE